MSGESDNKGGGATRTRRKRPRRNRRSRQGGQPSGGGGQPSGGGGQPSGGGGGESGGRPGRKNTRRRRRRRPKRGGRSEAPRGGGDGRDADRGSVAAVAAAHAASEARPEAIPFDTYDGGSSSAAAPELSPADLDRWEPPAVELDPDGEDVFVLDEAEADDEAAGEAGEGGGRGGRRRRRGKVVNLGMVRLPSETRMHEYDAGELTLRRGDEVVVQSDRGQALGTVVSDTVRMVLGEPLSRRVLRRINDNDRRQRDRNEEQSAEILPFARERVSSRRLPMKLTRVENVHGGNKAVFYFSADGRVDFRELVKDLAQKLRIRIEMRQIGVRDEAKMVGGIGVCGLRLCCHRHLTKFEPVSIRMAKDQNLVLNPQKVSGQCGRLKCCLSYEQQIYREQRKGMPKLGKLVITPEGEGKVVELDILRRKVRVQVFGGTSQVYGAEDVIPKHLAQQMQQQREKERREAAEAAASGEASGEVPAEAATEAESGGVEPSKPDPDSRRAREGGREGDRPRKSGRSRRSRGGRRSRGRRGDKGPKGDPGAQKPRDPKPSS